MKTVEERVIEKIAKGIEEHTARRRYAASPWVPAIGGAAAAHLISKDMEKFINARHGLHDVPLKSPRNAAIPIAGALAMGSVAYGIKRHVINKAKKDDVVINGMAARGDWAGIKNYRTQFYQPGRPV